MYHAILNDRHEFVSLLLQSGFNLGQFLTNRCLLKLYNDVRLFVLILNIIAITGNTFSRFYSVKRVEPYPIYHRSETIKIL